MKNSKNKNKPSPGTSGREKQPTQDRDDDTLAALISELGIKHWDFIIIGDGSGSTWEREAGWSSVSIERLTGARMVWTGGVNRGTVNLAEMMAYLQPLEWLASREADRKNKLGGAKTYTVHIVTDSEYCRNTGNSTNRMMEKNAGLWSVFDVFARNGFILKWHWKRRGEVGLNEYCDKLSKMARKLIKHYNLPERMLEDEIETRTVYEITPAGGGDG